VTVTGIRCPVVSSGVLAKGKELAPRLQRVLAPQYGQTEGPPVSSERRNKRNRTTAAPDKKDTQWSAEGVADGQALLVRPPERERECVCVSNACKWTGGKECLIDG